MKIYLFCHWERHLLWCTLFWYPVSYMWKMSVLWSLQVKRATATSPVYSPLPTPAWNVLFGCCILYDPELCKTTGKKMNLSCINGMTGGWADTYIWLSKKKGTATYFLLLKLLTVPYSAALVLRCEPQIQLWPKLPACAGTASQKEESSKHLHQRCSEFT